MAKLLFEAECGIILNRRNLYDRVTEWLRVGLQNQLQGFESPPGLKLFRKTRSIRKLGKLGGSEYRSIGKSDKMNLMIRDVTDLEVYKLSLELLKQLYSLLERIPKSEYDTVVQCKKSGKSVPANIAEGFAKRSSEAEFKRFLKIAIGSSDELITHLRTIVIAVPRLKEEVEDLGKKYKILSKRLNKLHKAWRSSKF